MPSVEAKTSPDWYKKLFDGSYIMLFEPLRPPAFTNAEIDHFVAHLELEEGAKILDLGCGYGRHSIALAKRGFDVVGQDLSDVLLAKAREDAAAAGAEVKWVASDMRSVPFEGEFDAVINNAFGYLEDDREELKVLEQVFKALKPGGQFLQWELPNRERWARKFQPFHMTRTEFGIIIKENSFNPLVSREYSQITILTDDHQVFARDGFTHRIFALTELVSLYARAGLQHVKHSALDGSPLTMETDEVMVLSRKPSDA
jgi:SAM-dependent methyltransferase